MVNEFVTLRSSDQEFATYMKGELGGGKVAIPVESFSVASLRERITFRIVEREALQRPNMLRVLYQVFRLELLPLTWGPGLATAAIVPFDTLRENFLSAFGALLALFCLHASAFSLNDYFDHWTGPDRIQRRRGSQVIQKGWLTAVQVQRLGWSLLVVGAAIGAPLVLREPMVLGLIGFIAICAIVGFSFAGRGFKSQGLGELAIFFTLGPFLTVGFAVAMGVNEPLRWLLLGVGFGGMSSLVLQSRQLETILSEKEMRTGSLVARLGFDRSKIWLILLTCLAPVALMIGWWTVELQAGMAEPLVFIFVLALLLLGSLILGRRLWRASSPLSSALWGLHRFYLRLVAFAVLCIMLGSWGMRFWH